MREQRWKGNKPAFFSCKVNSAQLVFMRSLSAIHRSACSCGGMPSHRFSIFASVGFEIACAWRCCVDRTMVRGAAREERRIDWRSIVVVESGEVMMRDKRESVRELN